MIFDNDGELSAAESYARFETQLARLEDPAAGPELAISVLEAAAFAGPMAWDRLVAENLLNAIEARLTEPSQRLAGYEQELFAPVESGLRARALILIEALGHRDAGIAREVERLLHAAGETPAAYRVERRHRRERGRTPPPARDTRRRTRMTVAVAGGHPRLRKMIRRDLAPDGVRDLREIPAAFEASRVGRDVAAKLAGADLAVLIVRQISHSTSDQVIVAAARLGVPVAYSSSAGISGVRREVESFAAAGDGAP